MLGTYAVKGSTSGSSGQCNISGSFGVALNLTGKCPVVWLKMEHFANFLGGYPRIFLGDTGLTNCYQWKVTESAGQPWALDGEWLRITLPVGSATVIGSPSRSSLPALTIQTFDNGSGPAVVHLGGLATMTEPAQWPGGVVSLAFDDGYISQFQTAKPYMDKYGYRGTAYLITETLWNHSAYAGYLDLPSAQALEWYSGWEIAAHAYTAANHSAGYVSIGQSAALADMQAAKSYLRDQGFKAVEQFAYPLGVFDSGTLANTRRLFGSGRTISSVGGFPDETFPGGPGPAAGRAGQREQQPRHHRVVCDRRAGEQGMADPGLPRHPGLRVGEPAVLHGELPGADRLHRRVRHSGRARCRRCCGPPRNRP